MKQFEAELLKDDWTQVRAEVAVKQPCPLSNLSAACRIATENVTPVGFGRFAAEAGIFQDLLRSDAIDVVRPDLARHGITQSRRISAVAEPYYVAVAPFHDGGPMATAAALNLGQPSQFFHSAGTLPDGRGGPAHARAPGRRVNRNRQGWIPTTSARTRIGHPCE
jgi:galactonate dehydratase